MIPTATFLAGALLSLLLPTIMLTLLVVWYVLFFRRVPDTADGEETRTSESTSGTSPESRGPVGEGP